MYPIKDITVAHIVSEQTQTLIWLCHIKLLWKEPFAVAVVWLGLLAS